MLVTRFSSSRDTYQDFSPAQAMLGSTILPTLFGVPAGFYAIINSAPELWEQTLAPVGFTRIAADFTVEGHAFGALGLDLRATTPLDKLRELIRHMGDAPPAEGEPPPEPEAEVLLSVGQFAAAVRTALRHYKDPSVLGKSPLLRSRMVRERAGAAASISERVAALQAVIADTARKLGDSPRSAPSYRAVVATYFETVPVQKQVADQLGVPFGTYRRHLTAGVTKLTELLWQVETEAA
jgi:hypothetical protein